MTRPNPIADRFIADLYAWLTPDLLYHCFTGEGDQAELDRIRKLDPWLLEPLLNKAERLWPERLQQIAHARKHKLQKDKADVQQFVLKISNAQNH